MKNHFSFIGVADGPWQVTSCEAIVGSPLETVARISVLNPPDAYVEASATWALRAFTSNVRYAERGEIKQLRAKQASLNRPSACCAALIPIKKNDAWWAMAQDERRSILEVQSRHIEIGLQHLPQIARQLYHSRDIGGPFDFLTWFEFAPEDGDSFNSLLAKLRASAEWEYVEREVELRLERDARC